MVEGSHVDCRVVFEEWQHFVELGDYDFQKGWFGEVLISEGVAEVETGQQGVDFIAECALFAPS